MVDVAVWMPVDDPGEDVGEIPSVNAALGSNAHVQPVYQREDLQCNEWRQLRQGNNESALARDGRYPDRPWMERVPKQIVGRCLVAIFAPAA
jgi:hypothetical protein